MSGCRMTQSTFFSGSVVQCSFNVGIGKCSFGGIRAPTSLTMVKNGIRFQAGPPRDGQ